MNSSGEILKGRTKKSLILELAIIAVEFGRLAGQIRGRGKFVAKDLHKLQSDTGSLRDELFSRIKEDRLLMDENLNPEEESFEGDLVVQIKKGI